LGTSTAKLVSRSLGDGDSWA